MKLGVGEWGLDDKLAMPEEVGLHSLVREDHNLVLAEAAELHSLAPVEEGLELHTLALVDEVAHNLALVEHSLVREVRNLVRVVGHSLVQEDHN